jgi:capsular polysaccharide biosynthesis protein/GGDEF domain-containing protein
MEEIQIVLRVLKRNWLALLLTPLLSVIVTLWIDSTLTPVYRSNAQLFVSTDLSTLEGRDLIYSYSSLDKASIVAAFVEIGSSRQIRADVKQELSLPSFAPYILSSVALPNTSVIELKVEGPDPRRVKDIADTAARKVIDFVGRYYEGYRLEILDSAYLPTVPIRPVPVRDAAISLVLGLVVGGLLAILYDFIHSSSELLLRWTGYDRATSTLKRSQFLGLSEGRLQPKDGQAILAIIHLAGLQDNQHMLSTSRYRHLLKQATKLIRAELRGKDLIARWSDDRFAILMPGISPGEANFITERIQRVLSRPQKSLAGGDLVSLSPRIGAVIPETSEPISMVIERAELALAKAGSNGSKPVIYTGGRYEPDPNRSNL